MEGEEMSGMSVIRIDAAVETWAMKALKSSGGGE